MKRIITLGCVIILLFSLVGCGGSEKENKDDAISGEKENGEFAIDYVDAETFETALNDGEKVNGSIVQFDVLEYKPDSAMGLNCWSGEHLNFISEEELDVEKGDIIIGRVTKEPSKILGSWKIPYEVLSINGEKVETKKDEANKEDTNQKDVDNKETEKKKETSSKEYKIGDDVQLGDEKFNVYKIDGKELYLMAQSVVATTTFSDDERTYKEQHKYEGSLVEGYVNKFVDKLEDKGYTIKTSGIIEQEDLYELGFKHSDGLSGRPYKIDGAPGFVSSTESYWVGGYCKYETMSWAYVSGTLDPQSCDNEYGVRPVIVIKSSEVDKKITTMDPNLTIKDIVNSDCAWTSEGGISNPYDRFFFDYDRMVFTNIFESSEFSQTCEFNIKIIDEKTIQVDGLMRGYDYPAEITIVNANKLRVRFLDEKYNDGDYFLNKTDEKR